MVFSRNDLSYLQMLLIEADFYQLSELSKAISDEIEVRRHSLRRDQLEQHASVLYKTIDESEANRYFTQGWSFVSHYYGNECYACSAINGVNIQASWANNICTACRENMSMERFVKHCTRFQPSMMIISKHTAHKTVSFSMGSPTEIQDSEPTTLVFDQSFG